MREAEYTYTVEDDSSTSSLTDNDKCDAKKAKVCNFAWFTQTPLDTIVTGRACSVDLEVAN